MTDLAVQSQTLAHPNPSELRHTYPALVCLYMVARKRTAKAVTLPVKAWEPCRVRLRLPRTDRSVKATGRLTKLTDLRLNSNLLSGQIPASMGSLTELTILLLQGNLLSGQIPASMGDLTKLIVLSMHSNQLSGAIPASMGSLTNLAIVRFFANNSLTGCVPEGLGYLLTAPDYSGLPPHDFGLDANNDGDYDDPGDTPPLCIPVPTAVTGLSIVAVIATDVGTGQTFYGNAPELGQ